MCCSQYHRMHILQSGIVYTSQHDTTSFKSVLFSHTDSMLSLCPYYYIMSVRIAFPNLTVKVLYVSGMFMCCTVMQLGVLGVLNQMIPSKTLIHSATKQAIVCISESIKSLSTDSFKNTIQSAVKQEETIA